jgi:DHA2 family multidrug resistance protein-like MFS transporter
MGAMFIGQQYMQDVLGFGTINAALPALFAGAFMIMAAPRSAVIVEQRGSRFTLLAGYFFVLLGFLGMLLLWGQGTSFWIVAITFCLIGVGIGLAGTPASRSLTGSVPLTREGMASGTADLQRDLGGAIFNSIFGALLAAGFATSMAAAIAAAPQGGQVPPDVTNELEMSYAGAQAVAEQYPQYATQITTAARESFLAGDQQAYLAGIIAVLIGGALVFFFFPNNEEERKLLGEYHRMDNEAATGGASPTS